MADAKIIVKVEGDTKDFKAGVADAEKSISRLKTSAKSVGAGISTGLKAGAVAFGALTAAIGGAIAAYKTQEQAEIKTRATIAATGKAAGLTADEIFKMASGLQNVTTFGDEAIIGGQNLLLTFKKIGGDVFPRATEIMLDMSEAMGQDLKSSALQLGKALNDPTVGLTALSRVGITFDDQQKEQIKTMQKAGDIAGAQAIIMGELESQFGGVARAAAEGTGGIDQTKNILGDIAETIGKTALPFVGFLNTKIKAMALAFQDTSAPMETFQTLLRGVLKAGAIAKGIFSTLGALIGNSLATAFEAASSAMEGNFKQAGSIVAQGAVNIKDIIVDNAKTTNDDLDAIAQIGVEKQKTAEQKKLEAIKEAAVAAREQARIDSETELAEKKEREDAEFERLLAKVQTDAEILTAEEMVKLETKLKGLQKAKDLAAVEELKKQGKHDQAMKKLSEIQVKEQIASSKARLDMQAQYTSASLALANNLATLSVAISGKSNRALFLLQKAAGIAQAYVSTNIAAARALAVGGLPLQAITYAAGAANIAAIAATTIQGFQNGGIVGGNSFTGDRVPAMVNSKEMILNQEQQAQLFAQANGAGGGGTEIVLTLKNNLVDFIEAELIERSALGESS